MRRKYPAYDVDAPDDDDQPEPWEIWLAGDVPHLIELDGYVGYGDEAEERTIEVEVGPNRPTWEEAFG